jgi:ankyrin repeat protein
MHDDLLAAFIDAACVPLDSGHATGSLERAESIRAARPEVATSTIHAAAILGDDATVLRFLDLDPRNATAKGGPRDWDALTHLTFSRYLRLDRSRSDGFVRAAKALLDAGASANTGWYEMNHQPRPEWESALYGASGIAHHPELTRLLLERGANPNDDETVYHTPEGYDNRALRLLVETGQLTNESLSLMLIRKHDWHDYEGVKWLLEHGADPNQDRWRGFRAIHHALARDNDLRIIELLLDHGADPMVVTDGMSAAARAARRGRGDVLESLERRRSPFELRGVERLIAACARNDTAAVRSIAARESELVGALLAEGGQRLAEFAGVGNTDGVRHLLDLGVPVTALYAGDGYWDVAPNSTALHVAAWRARHATVKLLIERGSPVDATDGKGRTPLALAIRACVDSYWTERRSPESVDALLRAGAGIGRVPFPSGYAEADDLLRQYGAGLRNTPRV